MASNKDYVRQWGHREREDIPVDTQFEWVMAVFGR
jgi:hypothetical protein